MKKIKKIAVPIMDKHISEKFEEASAYKIYTIFQEVVLKEKFIQTTEKGPADIAQLFREYGVTDVLGKQLDIRTIEALNKMKINVFVSVEATDPDWIIRAYMEGKLFTNGGNITE